MQQAPGLIHIFSGQMLFLSEYLFLNLPNVNSLSTADSHSQRHAGVFILFLFCFFSWKTSLCNVKGMLQSLMGLFGQK